MPVTKITIERFLDFSETMPILDVRSPGEYKRAHIPGAYSLPLFSDEERKIVGTLYKQESRKKAIKSGLDFFGVKMRNLVERTEEILSNHCAAIGNPVNDAEIPSDEKQSVLVHCWRGGMRSGAVAWLLDIYGFRVYTLDGGYKSFRKWVLEQFKKDYSFNILSGFTGSGKTEILQRLQKEGIPMIDLEGLAQHKGSAFGNLGMPVQSGQEMFENKLAINLKKIHSVRSSVWIEDESQRIGDVNIPTDLWKQMRSKTVTFLDVPFEERLKYIVQQYGVFEKEKIESGILRIKKRLGGLETKESLNALAENRIDDCFRILLKYYDRGYKKGLSNRSASETKIQTVTCETVTENNYTKLI